MIARNSRSRLLTSRNGLVFAVMGLISFALGYLTHPNF
jgi:hypothetical protein